MKNLSILFLPALLIISACSQNDSVSKAPEVRKAAPSIPEDFVLVKGGPFINVKSNLYGTRADIQDFYIGKYEVTQKEWIAIMGSNPSKFLGDNLPVESVSWYDCVEYCNNRSIQENLTPYYIIDKNKKDQENKTDLDDVKWLVTINGAADGYRLPTEAEWEYAAGGGQLSKHYTYSGSNDIAAVGWYWQNAGDNRLEGIWSWPVLEKNKNRTWPVGSKGSNELGLYDMSGNVREWCEDWYEDAETRIGINRVWRGGCWMGGDFCCASTFRAGYQPNGKSADQGFRLCRNKQHNEYGS
jgi:formylglycine-generating enzyme required for sulfatase activity